MEPQNPEQPTWQQRIAQAVESPAVSVVIIDGKTRDVIIPVAASRTGHKALHETLEQMGHRTALVGEGGRPHPLILVIEEMSFLMRGMHAYWAEQRAADRDLPKKSPAVQALEAVCHAGRSAGIYVKAAG